MAGEELVKHVPRPPVDVDDLLAGGPRPAEAEKELHHEHPRSGTGTPPGGVEQP
jgi:hypothetical protein